MKRLHLVQTNSSMVAENIRTCFERGADVKICCMSRCMSSKGLKVSNQKINNSGQFSTSIIDTTLLSKTTTIIHTLALEHFVALVKNKMFGILNLEVILFDKGFYSTRGSDNDMQASVLVLEDGLIRCNGFAAIEHFCADVGHVLAESGVFSFDQASEFARVAQYDDRNLAWDGL